MSVRVLVILMVFVLKNHENMLKLLKFLLYELKLVHIKHIFK